MATQQTITVGINVTDNGTTQKKIKDAKDLKKAYDDAGASASSIGGQKGTAGSRSVAAAAAPGGKPIQDYGTQRGSAGMTGASARDFANQAQGLGGIVRLYATYAANVFAVSAAFRALSTAMETTNMIQGLDQLSAASGTALGSLAQQLVKATDGAISLREAMETATKGSSSGMSTENILRMAKVAKQASQALGVDMADAVSRITRGITKLEPELLDEIGIFTRIDPAVRKYAQSIGKSATALTDFERRMAFANAVLEEGEAKFGAIDIPTNPYSKLLATLKDVTQVGLEMINKFLVPVISLLSSNPTVLVGALGFLASKIVSQALPVFRMYKAELDQFTVTAKEEAEIRYTAAKKALDSERAMRLARFKEQKDAFAEERVLRLNAAEDALRSATSNKLAAPVQAILKKDILDITDKELSILDKYGEKNSKISGNYRALAKATREARDANLDYIRSTSQLEANLNRIPGPLTAAGAALREYEQARKKAASSSIIANSAEIASIDGLGVAWTRSAIAIKDANLGITGGLLTRIGVAANIASVAVGRLADAFMRFLPYIGIVTLAYTLLSSRLSTNTDQVAKLNEALDTGKNNLRASEAVAKKYADTLSIASSSARATAFSALADSIYETGEALESADKSASGFNRFIDGIKGVVGMDLKSTTVKGVVKQFEDLIKMSSDPKLEKQLLTILGIKEITEDALKNISNDKIAKAFKEAGKAAQEAGKRAKEFVSPLEQAQKNVTSFEDAYKSLENTFGNSTPIAKYAEELVRQSEQYLNIIKDAKQATLLFQDILEDTSKIKMFPPDAQASILNISKSFTILQNVADSARKEILDAQEIYDKVTTNIANASPETKKLLIKVQVEAETRLASANAKLDMAVGGLSSLRREFESGMRSSMLEGFKMVEAPLSAAISKGIIESQKTLLSKLPQTAATIALTAELTKQGIALQKQELTATYNLVKSLDRNSAINERASLQGKLNTTPDIPENKEARDALQKQIAGLDNYIKALESKNLRRDLRDTSNSGIEPTTQILGLVSREIQMQTKLQELNNQTLVEELNKRTGMVAANYDAAKSFLERELGSQKAQRAEREASIEFLSQPEPVRFEEVRQATLLERQLQANLDAIEFLKREAVASTVKEEADRLVRTGGQRSIASGISQAAALEIETSREEAEQLRARNETSQKASDVLADRARKIELNELRQGEFNERLQTEAKLNDLLRSQATEAEEADRKQLEKLFELGVVSEDFYNSQIKNLDKVALLKERDFTLSKLKSEFDREENKFQNEISNAELRGDEDDKKRWQDRLANVTRYYNTEVEGINKSYAAKVALKELDIDMTARQKNFADVMEKTFQDLADAITDFAASGKLDFKELINSMLSDLLRYEMRLQYSNLFKSMNNTGGGIGGFLLNAATSIFGGAVASSGTAGQGLISNNMTQSQMLASQMSGFAKGGAFDSGVEKFAKGGTFTNSVVSSPTVFKFAKGTGLMGEAGPEAIMPLKRDSSGNLGVRAEAPQSNVNVTVINNSSEKAETRETMDSRGNRSIEIVIGDMVASEMSRPNSSVQNTMKNTYGNTPVLIRR